MRCLFSISAVVYIVLCALPAQGQNVPLPQRKDAALETIQQQIGEAEKEQSQLTAEKEKTSQSIDDIQETLVKLGGSIQKNESELSEIELRIKSVSVEKDELETRLEKDYGSISDLILALHRMRRVPPEAIMMRPEAPMKTAQSAMLLQQTLPAIKTRSENLKSDLTRLQDLTNTLSNSRIALEIKQSQLAEQRKELESTLSAREKMMAQIDKDIESRKATLEKLTREAKSLQDLIEKLAEEERARTAALAAKPQSNPATNNSRRVATPAAMPAGGDARLPTAGYITSSFGARDAIGAKSEGIQIETRPASIVVAPMGGIVRFAGYFKNYGNMVIVEHPKGYHSLIAGLEDIHTDVGRAVKAGEVIGKLPNSSSRGGSPSLYYELRRNGKSVDPAQIIPALKS